MKIVIPLGNIFLLAVAAGHYFMVEKSDTMYTGQVESVKTVWESRIGSIEEVTLKNHQGQIVSIRNDPHMWRFFSKDDLQAWHANDVRVGDRVAIRAGQGIAPGTHALKLTKI